MSTQQDHREPRASSWKPRVIGLTIQGSVSGADDAIFAELRRRSILTEVVNSKLSRLTRLTLLLKTFRPQKSAWGKAWRGAIAKSPAAFRARTEFNHRTLIARLSDFDVVLQVSGLFAPFVGRHPRPVAVFCDYTTRLAAQNYPPWFKRRGRAAERWYALETQLYRDAALLLTASQNTRSSLVGSYGVPAERVAVVGEGVREVHDNPAKCYDQRTILFVGKDFERKGGAYLLEAFAIVRQTVPDATLHIVGPQARQSLPGVIWHGAINDRTILNRLFENASVLALPSICEPFGLAVIEAMSHGLPVIGTRIDAMPEIVEEGVDGFLVPPADSAALANRLIGLLSEPATCVRMGSLGREKVRKHYLWSQVVDRVEDALQALLANVV